MRPLAAASVGALALVLALGAGAGVAQPRAAFTFGRTGGNIVPFSVAIARDGRVTKGGPVQLAAPAATVSAAARAGLVRLARAEGFFTLPTAIACSGTLPDVGSLFVTIARGAGTKKVSVRGDCNAGFAELFAVLSAVAGVR